MLLGVFGSQGSEGLERRILGLVDDLELKMKTYVYFFFSFL